MLINSFLGRIFKFVLVAIFKYCSRCYSCKMGTKIINTSSACTKNPWNYLQHSLLITTTFIFSYTITGDHTGYLSYRSNNISSRNNVTGIIIISKQLGALRGKIFSAKDWHDYNSRFRLKAETLNWKLNYSLIGDESV